MLDIHKVSCTPPVLSAQCSGVWYHSAHSAQGARQYAPDPHAHPHIPQTSDTSKKRFLDRFFGQNLFFAVFLPNMDQNNPRKSHQVLNRPANPHPAAVRPIQPVPAPSIIHRVQIISDFFSKLYQNCNKIERNSNL